MRILILGAGPAGISVAEHIREIQQHACVSPALGMISAEPFPPYSPPAMADHFLGGGTGRLYWKGEDVCDRLEIDFHRGRLAVAIDASGHVVTLDDGARLDYDRLVIATGSRLHAPLQGADLPGVYNFKSLSAAEELVQHARRGEVRRAAIVGAGFIGVEVALLLADIGLDVTLVEQQDQVMPRMLDSETAGLVADALRARGVRLRLGASAQAFAGPDHASAVVLEDGEVVTADACIAATGVKPNLGCLAGTGIDTDWGVRVDDRLRTTAPDVWAAGDVAETRDRASGKRFVHAIFPNAVAQGRVVAEQLLGFDTAYEGAESMNSLRHLGVAVIAMGEVAGDGESVMRGDGWLRRIVLRDGRIVGFRLAGDIRGAGVYRSLMLRRLAVGEHGDRLAEPGFAASHLASGAMRPAA